MSTAQIGVVQYNPVIGDIQGNVRRLADRIDAIARDGVDLIVTPELSILGYPPRDLLHRNGILRAQQEGIETLASVTTDGPPIVVGHAAPSTVETGPPVQNAATVLADGERIATYAKRLLPTYDVFDEHRYFEPGSTTEVVPVDGINVGMSICEDAWHDVEITGQQRHDSNPLRDVANAGADLIVTLSASPFRIDKPQAREQRFREHAQATECPIVFANQVGGNDDLIFDGNSFVMGADGTVIERLAGFSEATTTVSVPLSGGSKDAVGEHRWPSQGVQARQALRRGLADYFTKTGFSEAVVGLSGGIDSSVAATLAADALGSENVYGVALPSTITSQQSIDDARAVAEGLGIEFDVIPIGASTEALTTTVEEHGECSVTDVTAENLQARIRGDILMAIANDRNALVITPDNKSEAAVGYCTLYGDTVGALAPLGDCYKHLVYELATVYNDQPPVGSDPVIPQSVIEKPPSAELREDQTDADELPPYDQLDPVLEAYIHGQATGEDLHAEYDPQVVETVLTRLPRSEFKRWQTPPPLRITGKAFSRGWRYPIAADYTHVRED